MLDGLTERLQRLVEAFQVAEHGAESVEEHRRVRLEPQSVLELLDGFVEASQSLQCQTEIAPCFGIVRPQAQGHAATAGGTIELALGSIRFGEIGVKGRDARPQRDGPTDQLDGPGVVALLMAQHAEQVQGVGVLLFLRQDLLIQLGSRTQLAALVHLKRGCQEILHERNNPKNDDEPSPASES